MTQDSAPWSGEITQSEPGPRGTPPVQDVTITNPDGQRLDVGHRPPAGGVPLKFTLVASIEPFEFDDCPICLETGPETLEHVPQATLGGKAMTKVCRACNNGLGSRIEAAFLDWRDDADRSTRASTVGAPGKWRIPRLLRRSTPDGKFVLVAEGPVDPAVAAMLNAGQLDMSIRPPDMGAVELAALKNAYLAACLHLREIPAGDEADAIRTALIAARDTRRRQELAGHLNVPVLDRYRSYAVPTGPSLGLMRAKGVDSNGACHEYVITLAGTVCVSWPLGSTPPRLA